MKLIEKKPFMLMLSIQLFILGTFIYVISYRNIDAGINMCIIEKEAGIKVLDFDFFDRAYDFRAVYVLGLKQFLLSYIFFISSFIILIGVALK